MKPPFSTAPARAALLLLLAALAWPALAQYKVVLPDGSVTYTDRPPSDASARVTTLSRRSVPSSVEIGLPLELRQATQRYPVTLYTSADCGPCDSGRRFLQQRGIPYSERRVGSDEDTLALERAVGARTVPALSVGAQPLRGFSESDWAAYLDAAGYPKESMLPRNWPLAAPTPLVEKVTPARAPAAGAPAATEEPARAPEPPAPGGVRF